MRGMQNVKLHTPHKDRKEVMKFIKVTNQVNEVSRLNLEKLGLSTKRDNDETIGQFGSGIKFAPIAAIRKGMRWVFTGTDSKGDYTLEYVIKDDEGIPSVFYNYGDYEKVSSFSADAGMLSWQEPFQIYREIVANAIDESKLSGLPWSIDIVDESEIVNTPGEFSIFISATDELLEIHNNFDKYFSVNKTPLFERSGYNSFKVYESIDNFMRIYCKGVLVYCSDVFYKEQNTIVSSYFDYEFNDLELNEERTVKSIHSMSSSIIHALALISDEDLIKDVLLQMLVDGDSDMFELSYASSWNLNCYGSETWKEVFDKEFPDNIIIDKKNASVNALGTIKSRGYIPTIISDDKLYAFLVGRKIKNVEDIFGESFKYEYTTNIENYRKLSECVEIVKSVWEHANGVLDNDLGVLINFDNEETVGMTVSLSNDDSDPMILISEEHVLNATKVEIIATLLHELDHFVTGETDGDIQGRLFRDIADRNLAKITLEMYLLKNNFPVENRELLGEGR